MVRIHESTLMKKKCGCTGMSSCKECKPHEQLSFWEFDTSYIHLMGDDIGWDPEKGRLDWARSMKDAEIRKYLVKCECMQCKTMHRKFRYGWIEIDALWCIEARHQHGIKCPYCYHQYYEVSDMIVEIEDCGEPTEKEIDKLGLSPDHFIGLDDEDLYGNS